MKHISLFCIRFWLFHIYKHVKIIIHDPIPSVFKVNINANTNKNGKLLNNIYYWHVKLTSETSMASIDLR